MKRFADFSKGLAEGEDGRESDQAEDGPDECPHKWHQTRNRLRGVRGDGGLIILEAYLAQYQTDTLSHAGSDAEQYPLEGKLQGELVRFASAVEYGVSDTRERDQHGQPGVPRHGLAQHQPAGDAGYRRGERHEQLPVAGTEYYVRIEQTIVSEDISYQAGKGEPEPRLSVSELRVRCAGEYP